MAKLSEIESGKFIEELNAYLNSNIVENVRNAASGNRSSNSSMYGGNLEEEIDKLQEELQKNREQYNGTLTKYQKASNDKEFLSGERKILNERLKVINKELELKRELLNEQKKYDEEHKNNVIANISEEEQRIRELSDYRSKAQKTYYDNQKKLEDEIYKIKHDKEGNLLTNISKEDKKRIKNLEKEKNKNFEAERKEREKQDRRNYFKNKAKNLPQTIGGFMTSDKQVSITEVGKGIADFASNFGAVGKGIGIAVQATAAVLEMYDKVNKASADYARSVGGGNIKMQQMKRTSTGIASAISSWGGKAYKFDKILEHTAKLSEQTGRVMDHMSQMDFKSLEDLTQFGISPEILNQYDTFGLSVETIDKKIHDIYSVSGKHGLNAKAVTNQVNKNLKLAQNYTFAGGLKALTRMAEKATALKIDMAAASAFADKVSTLEGAATTGAELSVLGGSYARMGNPLSLLYGGLQDSEQLFDNMLNAVKGHVYWNEEKGMFDMNAFDRMQMKTAAQSMGVDYNTLWTAATQQGKRDRIDSQLKGKGFDNETMEYVRNIAQFNEKGEGYVTFHDGTQEIVKSLSELKDTDKAMLEEESKLMSDKDNAKIGDVLVQTRTMTEMMNDVLDTLKAKIFGFMVNIWGGRNEKKAKNQGLSKTNAEFFDDLSNDYEHSKITEGGLARLVELGLDKESSSYKSIQNKEMSQSEYDNLLIGLILKKQQEGYHYQGNSWFGVNATNNSVNDTWIKSDNIEGHALGGSIKGRGNSTSDSIPAMLSNGEFVINAKNAQANYGVLNAINNGNGESYFKQMKVEPIKESRLSKPQTMEISLKPLQINVGGEFNVKSNGQNLGNINVKELFTQEVLAELSRQLAKTLNHGVLSSDIDNQLKFV